MTDVKLFTDVLTSDYNKYTQRKPKERNNAFDFIRGLAVIFMILVHVLGIYSNTYVYESLFGEVIDFLGSPPAAPVFMFTMGVFFMFSSKVNNLKDGIIRGLKLFLLGCILSFLRDDLLVLLGWNLTGVDYISTNKLMGIWEIDILQFAGLAYILISLIKHYFKKPIWWLVIAVSIMIVSPFLWGISSDVKIIDWIFSRLWGMGDEVYFPIFGWLFYPLIGMVFGVCMKAWEDIQKLYSLFSKIGLALMCLGGIICITDFEFHIGDYYRSGPGSMIWILGFVFVWLGVSHKITQNIRENKIFNIIYFWSKEITTIYFIHWILIMWGTVIFGYEKYGIFMTILLMILMVTVSHLLSKMYKWIKQKH